MREVPNFARKTAHTNCALQQEVNEMVENVTAQAQKAINEGMGMVQKLTDENLKRMESFMGDWQRAQEKSLVQTQQTIDEATKLMKENLEYSMKMSAEFQKLAVASSRQAADFMSSTFKNG